MFEKKKLLGLILSLAMIGSLIPKGAVLAADPVFYTVNVYGGEISSKYDILADPDHPLSLNGTKDKLTNVISGDTWVIDADYIEGYTFIGWTISDGASLYKVTSDLSKKGTDGSGSNPDFVTFDEAEPVLLLNDQLLVRAGNSDTTIAANYLPNEYNVKFDPNLDATIKEDTTQFWGKMDNQTFTYDDDFKALNKNKFVYLYHSFKEWNTKPDGSGTAYADCAKVQNLSDDEDITLYAQWNNYGYISSDGTTASGVVSSTRDVYGNAVTTYIMGTKAYQMVPSGTDTDVSVITLKNSIGNINMNTTTTTTTSSNSNSSSSSGSTTTTTTTSNNSAIRRLTSYLEDPDNITEWIEYRAYTGSSSVNKSAKLLEVIKFGSETLEVVKEIQIPRLVLDPTDGAVLVYNTSYDVTSVADKAAEGLDNVKRVKVGNNVKSIGKRAFAEMDELKNVNISKKVKKIGKGAFRDCEKLNKANIKSSMKKINANAFSNCGKLDEITVKASKMTKNGFGSKCFSGTKKKKTVKLTGGISKKKFKTLKKRLQGHCGCKKATIKRGS